MPAAAETDLESLKSQSTVLDLVRTAIAFESQAEAFYRGLLSTVRPELRALVEELADEERAHHDHLQGLAASGELSRSLGQRMDIPLTLSAFEGMLAPPDLPADPSDDDVLDYALARERVAAEHYAALAAQAGHPAMRAAFAYLADEEVNHVAQLAERWGRLSTR